MHDLSLEEIDYVNLLELHIYLLLPFLGIHNALSINLFLSELFSKHPNSTVP